MERQPVKSSNISGVGYDPKTRLLELEFSNGRTYQFTDVPLDTYAQLMDAPSKGKFFFSHIRSRFIEIEVTPPRADILDKDGVS